MDLTGFRRDDGSFGIRNHLFALPAVVCANQVAIDTAMQFPQLKYIEHQHGCAQIGADLLQTRYIFGRLAVHPNVYASMLVSLGCEGLVARELFNTISSQTVKPLELVVIQESGGTLNATKQVEEWVHEMSQAVQGQTREPMNWSDLTIGVLFDTDVTPVSRLLKQVVTEFEGIGARLIVPSTEGAMAEDLSPNLQRTGYGESGTTGVSMMQPGSNVLETTTGLAAAGAHVIIHFSKRPHAFGSPLAPTLRVALDDVVYAEFHDDFDGTADERDVSKLVERVADVVNGELSVAESLGMDDFALYRIGPTV